MICFFAADLHGQLSRYAKLTSAIMNDRPRAVFLGGDLLPTHWSGWKETSPDFLSEYMLSAFRDLQDQLGGDYPKVFLILGNDDPKSEEPRFLEGEREGLWTYLHGKKECIEHWQIYGYSCVPPTPFLLKDWERYDVSRYVAPGCVSPEEGRRTATVPNNEVKWGTITKDLLELAGEDSVERAIFLFHAPPHETSLDRADLEGRMIDHVPLDVHVGSIAVRRFIEERQPLLTLHGHVHESARLTGEWKIKIGRTVCINAAHDGPELSLVRFKPEALDEASRELL